jgi:lysophospholipase L1-like esterase
VRLCGIGDSFVLGTGDPSGLGWLGRLGTKHCERDPALTVYNLGVRRDTSDDVLGRWEAETACRMAVGYEHRLVVSMGTNDCAIEDGVRRVEPLCSARNMQTLLRGAARRDYHTLVVGPPPVADQGQTERIAELDLRFAVVCADERVIYISVFQALIETPAWTREVADGDGSHPGAAGYELLAGLVLEGGWRGWMDVKSSS